MLTNRASGRFALITVFALLAVFAITRGQGQEPAPNQGVGDTVKKKLDSAVTSIKKGAQSASDAVQEQYHRAMQSVHNLGEHGRVYARLHWDKQLFGSKIEITVKGTVVTLRGTVADAKAKAKAVELAMDTYGITEVNDHLSVLTTKSIDEKK
jgi:osmotically-inducible protein OsmY